MAYGLGLAARMYVRSTYVVCVKKRKGERQRRALKFMWLSGVLDEVAAYRTARQVTATAECLVHVEKYAGLAAEAAASKRPRLLLL